MKKKIIINTNQRIDNPDINNFIDFNANEFQLYNKYLISKATDSKNGRVISGFDFSVSSGIVVEAALEDLALITSNGEFAQQIASEAQLTIALADDATNYIEAQVYTINGTPQTKAFWDPQEAEEYTQTANTITEKKIRLVVNQAGFTNNVDSVPVCIAVTASGAVQRIHDNYKNSVLTGSPANPTFKQSLLFSLNDDNNDGNTEDFSFGSPRSAKPVNSLENFVKAVQTQIKHSLGDGKVTGSAANDWFIQPPSDLFSLNQDRNVRIVGGGTIGFNSGTGALTFSADFNIIVPGIAGLNRILNSGESPITIDNGEAAYVSLDRDAGGNVDLEVTVEPFADIDMDKDVFVLAIRVSDVVYFSEGTVLNNGDTRTLGSGVATPSSTTNNAVVRWDGTNGSSIQNSGITIDDSNNITIPGTLTISSTGTHSVSEQFANEVIEEYARPTGTSVGVRGVAIATRSASWSTSSLTFVSVTDQSVTLTTTGRPVMLLLIGGLSSTEASISVRNNNTEHIAEGVFELRRSTTQIQQFFLRLQADSNGTIVQLNVPPGCITFIDTPSAGTHSYNLRGRVTDTDTSLSATDVKLVAYEL